MDKSIRTGHFWTLMCSLIIFSVVTIPVSAQTIYYATIDTPGSPWVTSVWSANLDGTNQQLVFTYSADGTIDALDYDPVENRLYFGYNLGTAGSFNNDLAYYDLDTNGPITQVLALNNQFIRDIRFNPVDGKVYWTEQGGAGFRLRRCDTNGSNAETLATLDAPRGVDIDYVPTGQELFYGNVVVTGPTSAPGSIFRRDLAPGGVNTLVQGSIGSNTLEKHVSNVATSEVFFTQRSNTSPALPGGVFKTDRNMGGITTVVPQAQSGSNLDDIEIHFSTDTMYWSSLDGANSVRSANLDGSNVQTIITGTAATEPLGPIAIDNPAPSAGAPEIEVSGNFINISDGDTTPNSADFTEFLDTYVSPNITSVAYLITNTGDADLNITTPVTITGPHAGDFSVIIQPDNVVPASGGTTSLHVRFDPSDVGLRSAEISITNDDSDENPFNFAIQGTGINPEIAVSGNSIDISDGDTTPEPSDFTAFGSANISGVSINRSYVITNSGDTDLSIATPISITGPHSSDFIVTSQPDMSVPPNGGTTSFMVQFDPSAIGLRSAEISFGNNDADEDPFNFAIEGTGTVSEILVVDGDGTFVLDGDSTPSIIESTEFGSIPIGTPATSEFFINNSGNGNLLLTGMPRVAISGSSDFAISIQPTVPFVTPSNSEPFTVEYTPSAAGLTSATVSISNNDLDEDPYTFVVQGTGADITPPQPVFTSTPPSPTMTNPFLITIDFGEEVNGFVSDDIDLTNGTLLGLTNSGGGIYLAGISADMDGPVSFGIPANIAEDLSMNSNLAATTTTIVVDTSPAIIGAPGDGGDFSQFNNLGFTWAAPTDPHTGIDEVELWIGTAPGTDDVLNTDVTGTTNTVVLGVPDGLIYASLLVTNGIGIQTLGPSSDGIFVDTQAVQVTLDGTPIVTNDPTPTLTGTFLDPDPSSGVTDIQFRAVDNGYPNALFPATFDDTETSGPWSGTLQVPLPVEGVYRAQLRGIDNAFNRDLIFLNNAIIFDQTGPEITYFGTPAGDRFDFFVNSPFTLRVETSDNLSDVTGFDPNSSDLININSLPATYTLTNAGPNNFEFLLEPGVDEQQYAYMISGPGAVFDGAGNPNLRGSSPVTFTYDITPPELVCEAAFAVVGGDVQSGEATFVSASFTEPVIGVDASSFTVSGPANIVGISPNPGPDTTYVLELENLSTGTVDVTLNVSSITDRAGNSLVAGASVQYEIVPRATQLPDPAPLYSAAPSGNTSGDRFGESLDLKGAVAVIGSSNYNGVGAVTVLVSEDATTFTERGLIQAAGLNTADNFGDSVATSGNWILVGAPGDDEVDSATGAAYFFLADDMLSTFTEVQKATVADFPSITPNRLSRMGSTVAIDGITAAIGQPLDSGGGGVFIYTLDLCDGPTGSWTPSEFVTSNDLTSRDEFGVSIALSGDTLLVGARRDDDRGSDTGSVYQFKRVGGNWNQIQKIVPGDTQRLDQVGYGVDLDLTSFAFGAPGDDDIASGAGAAYFYRRTIGDLFFFSDKVTSVDTSSGDAMGRSVAIKGSDVRTLLVGADLSDAVARDAGAVYVFQTTAGSNAFSQVLELTHPDEPKRNDRFGQEVAIDGEVGLIGNPFNDFAGNNNGGLLFLNTP